MFLSISYHFLKNMRTWKYSEYFSGICLWQEAKLGEHLCQSKESINTNSIMFTEFGARHFFSRRMQFTNLHLVDVGGVVSLATQRSDGLAATIRHHPELCLLWWNIHTRHPIMGVVATTAFELDKQKKESREFCFIFHTNCIREQFSQWKGVVLPLSDGLG